MRFAWIAAPLIGAVACVGTLAWSSQNAVAPRPDTFRQLELFADVLAQVEGAYVTPFDETKAIEAAINGMLSSLDPHSAYLNGDDVRDLQSQMTGEYGGLGLEVTMEEGVVKVISPIDDTPAAEAGIQAGDYLTAIDDEPIVGLTLTEAVSRMRGRPGTSITVTVAREGREPFDVQLTREVISPNAASGRLDGNDIAILRVASFNEKTTPMLQDAIREVRREAGGRLKGVVLDLRNNPGGLLPQAISVSDVFLDGGEVVSTRGRQPNDIERYDAEPGDQFAGLPVVVLINGGSASASEIVAGALQDRGRALVLGMTSFGKGSVQRIIPLQNGREGALRLTTARYYTPSGISIQGRGIEPDREVSQRRVDPSRLARLGVSEADLPQALENEDGARRRGPHVPDMQPPETWPEAEDFQLRVALNALRAGQVPVARPEAGWPTQLAVPTAG